MSFLLLGLPSDLICHLQTNSHSIRGNHAGVGCFAIVSVICP